VPSNVALTASGGGMMRKLAVSFSNVAQRYCVSYYLRGLCLTEQLLSTSYVSSCGDSGYSDGWACLCYCCATPSSEASALGCAATLQLLMILLLCDYVYYLRLVLIAVLLTIAERSSYDVRTG